MLEFVWEHVALFDFFCDLRVDIKVCRPRSCYILSRGRGQRNEFYSLGT